MQTGSLAIRKLLLDELPNAADVLSRGMRDNPNNVRVFGGDPRRRQAGLARMFRPLMQMIHRNGTVLGAFQSNSLVGVCAMAAPSRCQPGILDKLRIIPRVLIGNSPQTLPRLLQWTASWADHDLKDGHWHLGPIAVEADLQGNGIGSALMKSFCQSVDRGGALAYLETDKHENVPFYERFGFVVISEDIVVGEKNWFMKRLPVKSA